MLDCYPEDVLRKIVSFVSLSNLIQLISDPSQMSRNLKYAVNQEIMKASYRYEITMARPVNMSIARSESDFMNAREFHMFDMYCVDEELEAVSKIYSKMVCMADLVELQQFLAMLKPSLKLKLHLDMDFCGWRYQRLDLTLLFESLDHIRNRVIGLSLRVSSRTEVNGEIDFDLFENMEVLKLNESKFKGSLSGLKQFSLQPVIATVELALSLQILQLADYNGIDVEVKGDASLDELSFTCSGEPVPEYVKKILMQMTYQGTTSIKYSYTGNDCVDDFLVLVAEVAKRKGFTLKSLAVEGPLVGVPPMYPTEELELCYNENDLLVCQLKLPPTLKKLKLVGHNNVDFGQLFDILPPSLERIDLSFVCGDWDNFKRDLSKFKRLKHLNLTSNWLQSLEDFIFPDFLEELILEGNNITTIEGVAFPKQLKTLNLNLNQIQKLLLGKSSPPLQRLNLDNNFVGSIQISLHNLEQLLATCTATETLLFLQAENVRYLKLTNCRFPPTQFLNLTKLQLENCYQIDNILFPSTIKELELASNNLTEIPPHILRLENLRYLGLSRNKIESAILTFCSNSLEVLDLSSNDIEKFHLTFPKGESKLKHLDLGYNQLRGFSVECLGDAENYNCFWELDLSGNALSKDQIDTLTEELPKSTKSLWATINETFAKNYIER